MMKRQHITQLENQLAELIEGTFATLFGNKIRTQDIALQLARAMENNILPPQRGDRRRIAPDEYLITLSPDVHRALISKHPTLTTMLTLHLAELASGAGYRLLNPPQVRLLADAMLTSGRFSIHAAHTNSRSASSTAAMTPVKIPKHDRTIRAYLVINNEAIVQLDNDVMNIGRHQDNHIIINDLTVSRHHAQVRFRSGEHLIFNAQSKSGTLVNGVQIREHRLKSGDVIQLGNAQAVYMIEPADDPNADEVEDGTVPLNPY
ncbi:MAG: hypothetical protein GFH27_549367n15 [Chloroflexi bacterium AL-W]|nr:hypothetical protein [Chloroflexi bacterium AL-W]